MAKTNATLVGTAIGDALGMPFEMKKADHPALMSWDGSYIDSDSFHNLKAGQWTDDTQMSVALTKAILSRGEYHPDAAAGEYLAWYQSKTCRGMGRTTIEAMKALENGAKWNESGLSGVNVAGNGTAMRACPIGIIYRDKLPALVEAAEKDAIITHNAFEPKVAAVSISLMAAHLANGVAPYNALVAVRDALPPSGVKTNITVALRCLYDEVDSSLALRLIGGPRGYVIETVGMALYCVVAGDNFKETVLMAIKAGGDTDTTAAIAGGLAGTYYGLEAIPMDYLKGVEAVDMLMELDRKLYAVLPGK